MFQFSWFISVDKEKEFHVELFFCFYNRFKASFIISSKLAF